MRKKRPLDRSANVVRDASLIVIASEDKYAVRQYFEFFRSTKIQFKVLETEDCKSAPEHVLARLVEYMKEYDIGEGDEFWLVCDCDHWIKHGHIKNLAQVIQLCRQKGIQIALSNPCFVLVQREQELCLRGSSDGLGTKTLFNQVVQVAGWPSRAAWRAA